MISCKTYFPNAIKLTLRYNSSNESEYSLPTILNHILPLKQLTQLPINSPNIHFEVVIELLHFLPNLHTLMFNLESFNNIDLVLIQQNETFQIVSNTNTIRNMIIKSNCTFQQLKLLINICPQIQQLSMCIHKIFLEVALLFLLSNDNEYTHELHSLCITHSIVKGIEIINNLHQSQK
ncbi:unnamed protein product [Rotaria sordida]|nr:unnamed protein product [Rotaria sordida]